MEELRIGSDAGIMHTVQARWVLVRQNIIPWEQNNDLDSLDGDCQVGILPIKCQQPYSRKHCITDASKPISPFSALALQNSHVTKHMFARAQLIDDRQLKYSSRARRFHQTDEQRFQLGHDVIVHCLASWLITSNLHAEACRA